MGHSFRARITLLSVTVSGLVLAVFALSAWAFVYRIGLQKIDRDMALRVGPILVVPHPQDHWAWVENGLKLAYGGEGGESCVVLVKGRGGEVLYRSADWPRELNPDRFPNPDPRNPKLRILPGPPLPPLPAPRAPQKTAPAPPSAPGPPPPTWRVLPVAPPEFATARTHSGTWRTCTMQNSEVTLVLGVGLTRFRAEMARVRTAFLAALPAALLAIAVASWLASRRALRPVEELARVAERVTASSLDQRIPAEGADEEFTRLITVFNGMLDRLERSFAQAVRFSADAAHELQTPLTILQGEIEQALGATPSGSEQQVVFSGLLEEVQRLKAIVRKLLLLSRADSGQLRPALERVNLTELVQEAAEDAQALGTHLTVSQHLRPEVVVMADRDLLQQAIYNLTSNAVKYNREGGTVAFTLEANNGLACLTIANTGTPIPAEDQDRLFERFYRADRSRGRRVDGVGLGLSLARELCRAHGGDVTLVESTNDRTVFRMTLPMAAAATESAQASA